MDSLILYSQPKTWNTLQEYIFDCLETHGKKECCVYRNKEISQSYTYEDLLTLIKKIGTYFSKQSISNVHIALLGKTSYKWIACYLSALCYGIVVIPLDTDLSKEDLLDQFLFADANVLIYDEKYKEKANFIENKASCKKSICLNNQTNNNAIWNDVLSQTEIITPSNIEQRDTIAEIVFTSGTTGKYKGVMLSYDNILCNVSFGTRLIKPNTSGTLVSIMPNNHTYQLTVGILIPLFYGIKIAIVDDLKHFKRSFDYYSPTIMVAVPALLNMFRTEINRTIRNNHLEKKFRQLLKITKFLKKIKIDIRRLVFKKVLDSLGGKIKTFICSGAYLSEDLIYFFDDIGISVIQGYGITECSPIVSCNSDKSFYLLGEANSFSQVKCIDGEICVKGRNVMLGYYKDQEATQKAIIDGWFHTGDIGYVTENNCVSLKGRIKNLIINSNGENISPEEIENHFAYISIISECVVFSEDDIIAIEVYPNAEYIKINNILDVKKELHRIIKNVNSTMPKKMRIERIYVRDEPFPMTTTMKVKRYKNNERGNNYGQ